MKAKLSSAGLCGVTWCACLAVNDGKFCAVHTRDSRIRPEIGSTSLDCDQCGGTGDCLECDGTGDCTCHCGDEHDCHECNGSGTCAACNDHLVTNHERDWFEAALSVGPPAFVLPRPWDGIHARKGWPA